jgi:phage I-like protein
MGGSSSGGAAMTESQKLTDLVPVEVLTEVNTAIAVLEIQGPAITEALRQLDRATTMAWKAVNMLGVTEEEWEQVKREIGIERGW